MMAVSVHNIRGYCLGIGANPKWTGPPSVHQINVSTVLVSWEGLITRKDCADQFLVKSGLVAAPSVFEMSQMLSTDTFTYIFTERSPENEYFYQVIAREDKGFRGIEYNRSPETLFTTSRKKGNLKPELIPDPGPPAPVKVRIGDSEDDKTSMTEPLLKREEEQSGFIQDYLVWVVVGSLVVLLILVGIIYNIRKKSKGKSIDLELDSHSSDDEEDEHYYAEHDENDDLNEEEEDDYKSEQSEHSASQKSDQNEEELKSLKSQK